MTRSPQKHNPSAASGRIKRETNPMPPLNQTQYVFFLIVCLMNLLISLLL